MELKDSGDQNINISINYGSINQSICPEYII